MTHYLMLAAMILLGYLCIGVFLGLAMCGGISMLRWVFSVREEMRDAE